MSRTLAVVGVGLIVLAGWYLVNAGARLSGGAIDVSQIVYLLLVAFVFMGAVAGAQRLAKSHGAQGPGMVSSLMIWLGLISLVVLLYSGAQVWTALATLFR